MTILSPCPFCGNKEIVGPHESSIGDSKNSYHWIECSKCPCSMELHTSNIADIANSWNSRIFEKTLYGVLP